MAGGGSSLRKESKGLGFRRAGGLPLQPSPASHYLRSRPEHRRGQGRCDWQDAARYTITRPSLKAAERGAGARPDPMLPRPSPALSSQADVSHAQNLPSFSRHPEGSAQAPLNFTRETARALPIPLVTPATQPGLLPGTLLPLPYPTNPPPQPPIPRAMALFWGPAPNPSLQ